MLSASRRTGCSSALVSGGIPMRRPHYPTRAASLAVTWLLRISAALIVSVPLAGLAIADGSAHAAIGREASARPISKPSPQPAVPLPPGSVPCPSVTGKHASATGALCSTSHAGKGARPGLIVGGGGGYSVSLAASATYLAAGGTVTLTASASTDVGST